MPAKTFDEVRVQEAFTLVGSNKPTWFEENQQFYDGDHWQKGAGFKDVNLPPSHWAQPTISAGIMSIFTSQNLIAECIDRRVDALLSKMPRIEIKTSEDPDEAELERARRKKQALWTWFSHRCVRTVLKDFARNISLHGASYLRLRVPPGRLDANNQVPGDTAEDVLRHIFVDNHQRDSAVVIEDDYSGEKLGVIVFDPPPIDLPVAKIGGPTQQCAEVSFINKDGDTVIRVCRDEGNDLEEIVVPMHHNLSIHEGKHDLYITDQVKDAQKGINTTLTLMLFSNRESNFQQRVYFNAMPPGNEVTDPATGEKKFVPESLQRGMDRDVFLAGLVEEQEDGTIKIMQPSMQVVEPGTAERFVKTIQELRMGLYRQCRQLHMELTDDATSTGEARMQAAADHEQDINEFKLTIEEAGHWLFEAAWAMAQHLAGEEQDGHDELSVEFECIIDLGPIAASRRAMVVQEVQEGIKSLLSARAEIGVLDPANEARLVREQQQEDIAIKERKAAIIQTLMNAGFDDIDALLEFADIDVDFDVEEPPDSPPVAPLPPTNGQPLQVNTNPPPQ